MKVCGISDIHGNLIENIPKCDVLCICGDITPLNIQRDLPRSKHWWRNRFVNWVRKLPCKKVIVIPGNHDFYLEDVYNKNEWQLHKEYLLELSNGKIEFLLDESYYYKGIHFYGTPWIEPITFQESRWAFSNLEHYKYIPKCDILLTHENPLKNDYLYYNSYGKYKYHFYGHWHDGKSDSLKRMYNCSRLDNCYNFKKNYEFIVIDIMTDIEKKQVEQEFLDKIIEQAKYITASIGNNCVADWLTLNFKTPITQQDIEDSIPWDTSAEIPESSVINDMED